MYEGPSSFEKKQEIMPTSDEINQGPKEGPPSLEKEQEHIPTLEEVRSLFMKLINKEHGENCNPAEQRVVYLENIRREDEEGNLYYLAANAVDNSKGKIGEYCYQREGHYGMNQSPETSIEVIAHKEGDSEYVGVTLAKYVDGNWEILFDGNWEDFQKYD